MVESIIAMNNRIDIEQLHRLQEKPLPYTPGEPLFWNNPYISQQMLAAHLDPNSDRASRRPETIDRCVAWIVQELSLHPGDAILDLGCGPGLYTSRLAKLGFAVTGVDYSRASIDYAIQFAKEHQLKINYRFQDYLTLTDQLQFDVALLIYGDFCPLSPDQRRTLLANIHRALKPQGVFILDVSRTNPETSNLSGANWYASLGGFWRPEPHLVLEQSFYYPEHALHLDQYNVIEQAGNLSVYRVWRQEYTPETITSELKAGGFDVLSIWGDLTGQPYSEGGDWIGVVARKN